MLRFPVLFFILFAAFGCNKSKSQNPLGQRIEMEDFTGEDLYRRAHLDANGNPLSCAHCHALNEPALDAMRRPGHQIADAFYRTSFKNGRLTRLLDAVNSCRNEWMTAPSFTEDDSDWVKLEAFLREQSSDGVAPNLSFEIRQPPSQLTGGDVGNGKDFFNGSCALCHGVNAVGGIAPALAGTSLSSADIARIVRTSGDTNSPVYDGLTGGRMPFYAADRLSDDELRDVVAYLDQTESNAPVPQGDKADISLADGQTGCGSTHPNVGKTAQFSTIQHDVRGTAEIVDDCTIRFTGFSFDGGGINVTVYTGTNGNFNSTNSRSISVNMVGKVYNNESTIVRLPAGVTLNSFNSLSIWCVPFGLDFGSVTF